MQSPTRSFYLGAFVFGLTAYPINSIPAACASDLAAPDFMMELNAALVVFTLFRMTRTSGTDPRTPCRYIPRTSMLLGRMFKGTNGSTRGGTRTKP